MKTAMEKVTYQIYNKDWRPVKVVTGILKIKGDLIIIVKDDNLCDPMQVVFISNVNNVIVTTTK